MKNLFFAEFLTNIGKAILLLSFAKYMFDETGQVWLISLSLIAEVFISTILPIWVGNSFDNRGLKKLLIGAAIAHVVFCSIAIVSISSLGMSATLLFLTSVALSFLAPIMRMGVFTITPLLSTKELLEKNNGLLTTGFQAGQLLGMALSAWLLDAFSFVEILYVITCLYTGASLMYYLACRHVREANDKDTPQEKTGKENFFFLLKESKPYLGYFILSNFDFVTVAIFNILLVSIVSVNFGGSTYWLAGLDASFAIGALLGAAFVARAIRKTKTSISDVIAIQVVFLFFMALCLFTQVNYLMPIAILAIGLLQSYSGIYWKTLLHKRLPAHMMGRLNGIRYIISSIQVGFVALIISYAHEFGFAMAIAASASITAAQIMTLMMSIRNKSAEYDNDKDIISKLTS